MSLPTVRVDGETVYIGGVAMTPDEARTFAQKFNGDVAHAAKQATWAIERREFQAKVAEWIALYELTDVGEFKHGWGMTRRVARARQHGLPVRLDEYGNLTPARMVPEVGPGPALEFRVKGGRKWRPVLWDLRRPTSEVGDSYVAEWRVVE